MPWRAIATTASPIRARICRASRIVSREEALRLNPVVAPEGVTGGAVWYDYQMHQHRSRDAVVPAVGGRGRRAWPRITSQAQRFLQQDGRVTGVQVEDRLTSERFDVRGTVS